MITIEKFKKQEGEPSTEKMVDLHVRMSPTDLERIGKYAEKYGIPRAAAARYFIILGMQAHRKRIQLAKRYNSIIEEDMIREELVEEFHRRAAAEEGWDYTPKKFDESTDVIDD